MNPVRRLLPWAALLAGAALIAAGTWVVALRFQSPAQREAAASPPPAGPVTVQVTRGDLTEQTTVLATAARSEAVSVAVPAPAEGRGVVTRSGAIVGGSVSSGGAVLWVNSRPVIALAGQFALYRDLYLGARGDDVRMVQQALADLGYDVGVDGELGAGTADAVRDLYRSLDAQAPQDADAGQAAPAPHRGRGQRLDGAGSARTPVRWLRGKDEMPLTPVSATIGTRENFLLPEHAGDGAPGLAHPSPPSPGPFLPHH